MHIDSKYFKYKRASDRGIALLYFSVIILPIMLVLTSLLLDIGMYLSEERSAQIALDKAGIYAQRFLPYKEESQSAFYSIISQYPQLKKGQASYHYLPESQETDTISLLYQRAFQPFFANYFGGNISFPLRVRSNIRSTPFEVYMMIDSSAYLAPAINSSAPWKNFDESEQQLAWIFGQNLIRYYHDLDNDGYPQPVHSGIATQHCFSPPFRVIKQSAVELYNYLASFRDNSLGIGVYPAETSFAFSTPLVDLSPAPKGDEPSALEFYSYNRPFVKNEHCAAAAEREEIVADYSVPKSSDHFEGLWRKKDGGPLYMIRQVENEHGVPWTFDESYAPYMSASELIWSQAVRSGQSLYGDTVGVIQDVSAHLLTSEVLESRQGLQNATVRQGIIFAGDTAWVDGERLVNSDSTLNNRVAQQLRESLQNLARFLEEYDHITFHLYYLTFRHQGNRDQYERGVLYLEEIFHEIEAGFSEALSARVRFNVFHSTNPEALQQQVVSYLSLSRKIGVVAR